MPRLFPWLKKSTRRNNNIQKIGDFNSRNSLFGLGSKAIMYIPKPKKTICMAKTHYAILNSRAPNLKHSFSYILIHFHYTFSLYVHYFNYYNNVWIMKMHKNVWKCFKFAALLAFILSILFFYFWFSWICIFPCETIW